MLPLWSDGKLAEFHSQLLMFTWLTALQGSQQGHKAQALQQQGAQHVTRFAHRFWQLAGCDHSNLGEGSSLVS